MKKFTVGIVFLLVPILLTAGVQRGGGGGRAGGGGGARAGGGGAARSAPSGSVNRDAARTSVRSPQDVNRNVTRNGDINNVNVNRNTNIDRDINVDGNIYGGYDRWGHPIAAGVAMGTAVGIAGAATAAAFGSTVAVLPSNCATVVVDGIGYSQCGSTWYQPNYSGTDVQYTVVNPPQ